MGVAIIIGLALALTIFFTNSDHFTKTQKIILAVLILFPPAQIVFALIFYLFNKYNNSL